VFDLTLRSNTRTPGTSSRRAGTRFELQAATHNTKGEPMGDSATVKPTGASDSSIIDQLSSVQARTACQAILGDGASNMTLDHCYSFLKDRPGLIHLLKTMGIPAPADGAAMQIIKNIGR
jgi:hypothetical protein